MGCIFASKSVEDEDREKRKKKPTGSGPSSGCSRSELMPTLHWQSLSHNPSAVCPRHLSLSYA